MSTFRLDSSRLSGSNLNYVDTPIDERARSVQVEYVQAGANQDIQILGYAVRGKAGEIMAQEPS